MRPVHPHHRGRWRLPTAALVAMLLAVAAPAHARPGDLDPGFGTGGKVVTDLDGNLDDANAVAVQPNGKIVAAGFAFRATGFTGDFALTRYRANGTLDPGFGTGGKVLLDFGGAGRFDEVRALAVRSGGRIVAAGATATEDFTNDFALARFRADGTLDPGFGAGGKVTTDFAGSVDRAQAVALQADGKIVAAGLASVGPDVVVALVRYHPDGTLDPGFGTGGRVTTKFDGFFNEANAVVVRAGGRIVAAGSLSTGSTSAMALAGYLPNGTLDPGFGTGGRVTTDFNGTGNADALVALPGGRLVAAGNADPGTGTGEDFALVRYRSNGTLDPSFGVGGRVTTDFGGGTDLAHALAVQADGKLVAAGSPDNVGFGSDFALARYLRR